MLTPSIPFHRRTIATLISSVILGSPFIAYADDVKEPIALPTIKVKDTALPADTAAKTTDEAGGFRPATAEMGALGKKSLKDVPASVTVLNKDMLEDRQINSLNDALKYLPSTQMEARGGTDVGRPQSRGMEGSVVDNTHLDGFNVVATTALPIAAYDRIEVLNSLTGAIYGPASPAGDFNFVMKRPTADYENTVTTGISGNGAPLFQVDAGGSPSKYFGYRVNLLREEGDGYADNSHIGRTMGSVGLDLHPTDHTTVEINASYYKFKAFGFPGGFSYSSAVGLPSAFDASKAGYGESYAGNTLTTKTESIKVIQDIGPDWKLSVGVLHQEADRSLPSVTNTLAAGNTYTQTLTRSSATASKFDITSNQLLLNGTEFTGPVKHDLVIGTTGYSWDIYTVNTAGVTNNSATLGTASTSNPQTFAAPASLYGSLPIYKASTTRVQNVILGDTITWNRYFSTVLSGSLNHFDYTSYSTTGASSGYSENGFSGNAALLFKPVQNVTTYISYADTLEIGGVAPTTAANAGEVLKPVRSKQTELGVKTTLGNVDLSTAIFHLTRPLAYTDANNTYREEGLQRNNGFEMFAAGSITRNLKVFGGFTWLSPILEDAYSTATSGKNVVGVPRLQANMLVEYALGHYIPGVSVNANVHYVSRRAADTANSSWAASYTTLDLGTRYVNPHFYGHKLTVNFLVNNVTDRRYWASIFPGTIYGSTGSNTAFLGAPRTFELLTSLSF